MTLWLALWDIAEEETGLVLETLGDSLERLSFPLGSWLLGPWSMSNFERSNFLFFGSILRQGWHLEAVSVPRRSDVRSFHHFIRSKWGFPNP